MSVKTPTTADTEQGKFSLNNNVSIYLDSALPMEFLSVVVGDDGR
jgi:hypothetical protein